jgi:D-glycero-D-manno-heptose 1,7-bisphosphate phosphatase
MKVAFLDRDGTIVKDYPDDDWRNINEPEFIDGSFNALKAIRSNGYEIIIVTNQYIINDGVITLSQYNNYTEKLLKALNDNGIDILDIFHCPHSKKENCNCYKPKPGLIDIALKKYPDIELDKSFIVGDSVSDIELGHKFGIKKFGININSSHIEHIPIKSLAEITNYL